MSRSLSLALLLATAGLAACSTAPGTAPAQAAQPADGFQPFHCTDGENVGLRFIPERNVAVLQRQGRTLELPQQVVASGFLYSNGPTAVRGKGQEFRLEIGRMAPIHCQAR